MQPQPASNDWRPIVPYHVNNQAGFSKSVINGRSIVYLVISKMVSLFKYLQEVKVAYQ